MNFNEAVDLINKVLFTWYPSSAFPHEALSALRREHEEQRKLLSAWQTVAMDLYEALPDEIEDARKQFVELAENGEIPASRKKFEEQRKLLQDAARTTEPQAIAFSHRTMDSANYLHVPELTLAMVREVAALHARITAALNPQFVKGVK